MKHTQTHNPAERLIDYRTEQLTCDNLAFTRHLRQEAITDLEIALQDYNDGLDQVRILALADDLDPQDIDDLGSDWTANYLDVTPDRRRTLASVSGSSRLVAIAWLSQAALYSILIIGML